jgi:hypothetical protein
MVELEVRITLFKRDSQMVAHQSVLITTPEGQVGFAITCLVANNADAGDIRTSNPAVL